MVLSYCGLPESDSSPCSTAMSHVKSQMAHHEAEMGSRRHACACVWASDMIPAVKRRIRTRAGGSNGSIGGPTGSWTGVT